MAPRFDWGESHKNMTLVELVLFEGLEGRIRVHRITENRTPTNWQRAAHVYTRHGRFAFDNHPYVRAPRDDHPTFVFGPTRQACWIADELGRYNPDGSWLVEVA
jgi:hypothetical protein